MFTVFALLLCYSLLTFGAVLPSSSFVVGLCWITAIAVCLVIRTLRRGALDASFVALFALAALSFGLLPVKLAVGFVAGAWAFAAARSNDVVRTLRFSHFLLLIGILEALFGLVQFFVTPYWVLGYTSPHRSSGTLINRNHFAGLLEMFVPIALGLAYTAVQKYDEWARAYLYLIAGAFMGLALLFSVSRMGIFSFLATLLFLGLVVQGRKSQKTLGIVLSIGMFGLVLAGALWIGTDVIVQRYAQLTGEDAVLQEGRVVLFADTAMLIRANPFGIGIGYYQDRFREYQTLHPELLFDHAHNDYLETAAEWGIPWAIAFWIFVFCMVVRAVRLFNSTDSPGVRGILLACIGGVFSILVHSLTDFNLQIPSNAMLFFTLLGISLGMPGRSNKYLKNA
jgi:O-antigen ligase